MAIDGRSSATVVTEHTASPGVHLRAFWKESDGFISFSLPDN